MPFETTENFPFETPKTSVFLPNIRSGWNVGAFFRTADAFGVDRIFLSGFTPFPPHKEIEKTALGAENFVPWSYFENPLEGIKTLKKMGIWMVGMELSDNAVEISEKIFAQKPVCLVMGNEVEGISAEMLAEMDSVVFLPMRGKKQSLNVSVAGAVGMWEMQKSIFKTSDIFSL